MYDFANSMTKSVKPQKLDEKQNIRFQHDSLELNLTLKFYRTLDSSVGNKCSQRVNSALSRWLGVDAELPGWHVSAPTYIAGRELDLAFDFSCILCCVNMCKTSD